MDTTKADIEVSSPLLNKIVKDYRTRQELLGMNDNDLSKASGVTKPVLSELRSGKKKGIQLSTLERIAAALNWEILIDYKEIEAQG